MPERLVVVGLGNPGKRYRHTRHNMGFMLLDRLGGRRDLAWARPDNDYDLAETSLGATHMFLVRPRTYMNRSGRAVRRFCERLPCEPRDLLVACDDIALTLGQIRLRRRGSDGGHNGLASIIDALGTEEFPRLRMGIGRPEPGVDPADYVLDPFPDGEWGGADACLDRARSCVQVLIEQGLDRAMNEFNAGGAVPETD